MFYFASGHNEEGERALNTGMAISKSSEEIGPGDWEKLGAIEFTNPEALLSEQKKWLMA